MWIGLLCICYVFGIALYSELAKKAGGHLYLWRELEDPSGNARRLGWNGRIANMCKAGTNENQRAEFRNVVELAESNS